MPKREPSFEEAYKQLEEIVRRLEAGGLPLNESIALYEEGIRLAKMCGGQLDAAELRIAKITADADATGEPDEPDEPPL